MISQGQCVIHCFVTVLQQVDEPELHLGIHVFVSKCVLKLGLNRESASASYTEREALALRQYWSRTPKILLREPYDTSYHNCMTPV